jgi:DNA end-binding protein Ku
MAATLWRGQLTFGLVSVPIKLSRAARAEKVRMHNLQRDTKRRIKQVFVARGPELPEPEALPEPEEAGEPDEPPIVKRTATVPIARPAQPVAAEAQTVAERQMVAEPQVSERQVSERQVVAPSDLVRGFEFEKGRYVEFEKTELDSIAPRNSSEMQIVEFVGFSEVDPIYLENSYYVAADKGGEKTYALLFQALRETGQSAVAEFVMYRRDQIMILRAGPHGMIGHTLFHEDELKRENEYHADTSAVSRNEMHLAIKLIEALAAPFEPRKFKDKYRERLRQAISEKIESGTIQQVEAEVRQAPVIDIMTALRESLTRVKKPPASEPRRTAAGPGKKRAANS